MKALRKAQPIVVLLLLVLALASAPPAAASQPPRSPFPTADTDYPASVCGFPVHLHVVHNNEYYKDFGGDPDLSLVSGRNVIALTNTNTGKTVTINASGPGKLYLYNDGSMQADAGGNNLFDLSSGHFTQYPRLLVSSGRVHISWDAGGTVVSFSLQGIARDTCAALG